VKEYIRLDGNLFVGTGGIVAAEIVARNVVIKGSVISKVVARQQLEVQLSGRFNGVCVAASIEIRVGAMFDGNSKMISGASVNNKCVTDSVVVL